MTCLLPGFSQDIVFLSSSGKRGAILRLQVSIEQRWWWRVNPEILGIVQTGADGGAHPPHDSFFSHISGLWPRSVLFSPRQ